MDRARSRPERAGLAAPPSGRLDQQQRVPLSEAIPGCIEGSWRGCHAPALQVRDRAVCIPDLSLSAEEIPEHCFPTLTHHGPARERDCHHRAVQFSPVAQSCPTLCDPMDYSTSGFPVHQQLLELTQIHVHQVGDTIQPSHPSSFVLFSSCPQSFPASGSLQMSQLFASGGLSIGVSGSASVLPMNIQD